MLRSFERRAVDLVMRGLRPRRQVVYVPDAAQVTLAGDRVVHLQQYFLGVPLYEGRASVVFDAKGSPRKREGARPLSVNSEMREEPVMGAASALRIAADHVSKGLLHEDAPSLAFTQFPSPLKFTVLDRGPFEKPPTAHLALLRRRQDVRLAWVVYLALRGRGKEYEILVAADRAKSPEILLCKPTTACAGRVQFFDSATEALSPKDFPLARNDFPDLGTGTPSGFPWPWTFDTTAEAKRLKGEVDSTSGNSVRCMEGKHVFTGTRSGPDLAFEPGPGLEREQRLANAFYLCNLLHDFFYLLGFDERKGNLQQSNRGFGSGEGDRLEVWTYPTRSTRPAYAGSVRRDGNPVRINLSFRGDRHTALDGDIVIHEYAHAVTSRMVGGPDHNDPLWGQQGQAMAEGYSDYFAVTIQNYYRRKAGGAESFVFGHWSDRGSPMPWRTHPYNNGFPWTCADLGQPGVTDPHDAGQVWCHALLSIHRVFEKSGNLSKDEADDAGWKVVMTSLPLVRVGDNRSPGPRKDSPGTTLVDGRLAILDAYDSLVETGAICGDRAGQRTALVSTFTRLGLGPRARSTSTSYRDLTPDFGP